MTSLRRSGFAQAQVRGAANSRLSSASVRQGTDDTSAAFGLPRVCAVRLLLFAQFLLLCSVFPYGGAISVSLHFADCLVHFPNDAADFTVYGFLLGIWWSWIGLLFFCTTVILIAAGTARALALAGEGSLGGVLNRLVIACPTADLSI